MPRLPLFRFAIQDDLFLVVHVRDVTVLIRIPGSSQKSRSSTWKA